MKELLMKALKSASVEITALLMAHERGEIHLSAEVAEKLNAVSASLYIAFADAAYLDELFLVTVDEAEEYNINLN